jgi:hypothetical protein
LSEYRCSDFVTPGCDAQVFNIQHATGLFTSRDRNFFRRRNSGIQQEHHELPTSSPSIEGSSWTQLNEMQKQKNEASELDSTVVSEAGGGNHAVELGDWRRSVVYEMEGSFGGAGGWRVVKEKNRRGEHNTTKPSNS